MLPLMILLAAISPKVLGIAVSLLLGIAAFLRVWFSELHPKQQAVLLKAVSGKTLAIILFAAIAILGIAAALTVA